MAGSTTEARSEAGGSAYGWLCHAYFKIFSSRLLTTDDSMLHLGRRRTLDALRASGMWWSRQGESVQEFVRRCDTCAFSKVVPRHGAMHIPPNGSTPWQIVVVYLEETSSGNGEAAFFSCRFCRSIRAFAVPRILDSKVFLNIVAVALVPDVGVPLMMISDRGSNLISALCMAFFYEEYRGTDPRLADAHMHTAVGINERSNNTPREMVARAAYFDHASGTSSCYYYSFYSMPRRRSC